MTYMMYIYLLIILWCLYSTDYLITLNHRLRIEKTPFRTMIQYKQNNVYDEIILIKIHSQSKIKK